MLQAVLRDALYEIQMFGIPSSRLVLKPQVYLTRDLYFWWAFKDMAVP